MIQNYWKLNPNAFTGPTQTLQRILETDLVDKMINGFQLKIRLYHFIRAALHLRQQAKSLP